MRAVFMIVVFMQKKKKTFIRFTFIVSNLYIILYIYIYNEGFKRMVKLKRILICISYQGKKQNAFKLYIDIFFYAIELLIYIELLRSFFVEYWWKVFLLV